MPTINVPPGKIAPTTRDPGTFYISVVIPFRNEFPQVVGTMLSVVEELEAFGYPYEIIVVSNLSDDCGPEAIQERFRHWVKEERLRVIEFNDRPACWHARNVGVAAARGEVLIILDAHMSVSYGTLHSMLQLWSQHGGLWHSASQMWGDPRNTRLYGYSLKVEEKFWGNLSRHIPQEVVAAGMPAYTVPMAQFSLFLVGREEYNAVHGFHPAFKIYGGGEPYLSFRWQMLGKRIWMWPRGLVRHAFGLRLHWKPVGGRSPEEMSGHYLKGKGMFNHKSMTLSKDAQFLSNSRGYAWTNDALWYNFLLCAYVVGGDSWLNQRHDRYLEQCHGVERYISKLAELRIQARRDGDEEREWLRANQVMDFDTLIAQKPWEDYATVL